MTKQLRLNAVLLTHLVVAGLLHAEDWPMWRYDSGRTAQAPQKLPQDLHLNWLRDFPRLKPAWRESRLQFDAGYEPVVMGKMIYVASSRDDSLIALDTETGHKRWEFFAEGAIRFAPVAWNKTVIVGADDGQVYCLAADSGALKWKFRAVPSSRKVLGNGKMISLWPVRGGPVVHEGRLYFAAGVWSFEGVFVYCLDAKTGRKIWRNDEASFVYGTHPHGAEALGGVTPQGYLLVSGGDLIVPCGQATPARFDLGSGKLKSHTLPKPGRRPGGWFASAAVRRGEVILDAGINRDLHEDRVYQGPGSPGVRSTITLAGKRFRFGTELAGVKGKVHTVLAADGKLFVVNQAGQLYCFGKKPAKVERHRLAERVPQGSAANDPSVEKALKQFQSRKGYAVVLNGRQSVDSSTTISSLLTQSRFHVIATGLSNKRLLELQRLYRGRRDRLCLLSAESDPQLPPYCASLLISTSRLMPTPRQLELLRPYGGVGSFLLDAGQHDQLGRRLQQAKVPEFRLQREGNMTLVHRLKLPGAANYRGGWSSPDERVRAPLGVLWFGDAVGHFKRSPQPWFMNGVMISYPKDWMERHRANRKPPYQLLPPVYSDVYSGRVMANDEAAVRQLGEAKRDLTVAQPNQYRPPTQRDAWKPKQPIIGERLNPLTGVTEPRAIPKSYGCDGGVDYGNFYTMRSGTPAFYDKRLESGVCNISGPRSGCTNSIIPACGVLNVPYFYEGCTCSYPLPVGLALVSMPVEHEQWSSWGPGKADKIQRVGINFGAPGDRMTPAGTLWLDFPNRGGPSPEVAVQIEPPTAKTFYRHSLFLQRGDGWPWVAASGIQGARRIKIGGIKPGTYTVRLFFAARESSAEKRSTFTVRLNQSQPRTVNLTSRPDRSSRSSVFDYTGVRIDNELVVQLTPQSGDTVLSGVEIVRAGLKLDPR